MSFRFQLNNEQNFREINDFIYESKILDSSVANNHYFDGQKMYTSFYFRSGLTNKVIIRKYVIFQDFLQSLGSFLSIFIVLFQIANSILTSHKMNEQIAKTLYRIKKLPQKTCFDQIKNFFNQIPPKTTPILQINKINEKNNPEIKKTESPSNRNNLTEEFMNSKEIDRIVSI